MLGQLVSNVTYRQTNANTPSNSGRMPSERSLEENNSKGEVRILEMTIEDSKMGV